MAKQKTEKKKFMTRVICIAIAGIMVLSILAAALLSQAW